MKTILITGANGNLGIATVKKFHDSGYRVIAVDAADDHLNFAKGNSDFQFQSVDLTNVDAANKFIGEIISQHKKIDGALMLVGGFAMGNIKETSVESVQKMIRLNFETAFNIAHPLFAHMQDNGYGRLVFIGARPALKASQGKGMIAYALSKSMLFKLAEFLNEEGKSKNVVASVVVPSTIDTAANRASMPDADPNNWVKPEAIADVLEFICSDKGLVLREPVYKVYNNA